MGRGRQFVPSVDPDGSWFVHRGSNSAKLERTCDTSTGSMMNAQFVEPGKPAPPPEPFRAKTMINYKISNVFSEHDNRHSFQDHGVYFGDFKTQASNELLTLLMGKDPTEYFVTPKYGLNSKARPKLCIEFLEVCENKTTQKMYRKSRN